MVGFSSNREARINLEDAIFDNEALAMLTGNAMVTGAQEIYWNEVLTLDDSFQAMLSHDPVLEDGALISVYNVLADGTNGTELDLDYDYTLGASGNRQITCSGNSEGDNIRVYYNATTDDTAATVSVTSDSFGGSFKVVLDVLIRDEYTKEDFVGQLIIPNGKFEDNFEMSLN